MWVALICGAVLDKDPRAFEGMMTQNHLRLGPARGPWGPSPGSSLKS